MIDYGNETINSIDKKRQYLIDKINAYFKRVVEYKANPYCDLEELAKNFGKKVDNGLKIFK